MPLFSILLLPTLLRGLSFRSASNDTPTCCHHLRSVTQSQPPIMNFPDSIDRRLGLLSALDRAKSTPLTRPWPLEQDMRQQRPPRALALNTPASTSLGSNCAVSFLRSTARKVSNAYTVQSFFYSTTDHTSTPFFSHNHEDPAMLWLMRWPLCTPACHLHSLEHQNFKLLQNTCSLCLGNVVNNSLVSLYKNLSLNHTKSAGRWTLVQRTEWNDPASALTPGGRTLLTT